MLVLLLFFITTSLCGENKKEVANAKTLYKEFYKTIKSKKVNSFSPAFDIIDTALKTHRFTKAAYYIIFAAKFKMPYAEDLCFKALNECFENLETKDDEKKVKSIMKEFGELIKNINPTFSEDFFCAVLLISEYIEDNSGHVFSQQEQSEIKETGMATLKRLRTSDEDSSNSGKKSTDSSSRPSKRKKRA